MRTKLVGRLLYLCFFLSGASGLIFEIVWMRKLSLIFGSTVYAVSTVVAVFMGGLALGSWLFGRAADRSTNCLRLYTLLELGIGAAGVAITLTLLPLLDNIYIFFHGLGFQSGPGLFLIRFLLSVLIMLGPTVLMGGTLPVVGRYLVRTQNELGSRLGFLYGINTLGAVTGTLGSGFWLIALYGETVTILIAAAGNLIAGLIALLLLRGAAGAPAGSAKAEKISAPSAYSESRLKLVPWLFALSGFAALAYEVLWTRALIYFVGLSVHAFTIILACFLAGIALGSLLATRFVDRISRLFLLFGVLQWLMALSGVISLPLFGKLNLLYLKLNLLFGANSWSEVTLVKFILCFAVLGLPTLAMGAAFPTVNRLYIQRRNALGTSVGELYAANTAGTILGSLCAGFLLLPLAGITGAILAVAGINALLALAATALEAGRGKERLWLSSAALVVFLTGAGYVSASGSLGPLMRHSLQNRGKEILFFREGTEASLAVLRNVDGQRELNINGESTAYTGFDDIVIHKLLSHLPILFHRDPRSVLVVGFGFGSTVYTATCYALPEIECVELVPDEVRTAGYFLPENHGVLESGQGKMDFNDGRNVILTSRGKYDVISFDAIHPKLSPMLYTLDFYRLCSRALAPGGTICAWLPTNGLTLTEFKSLLRSFVEVFPESSLWWCNPANVILLGSTQPLKIDFPAFRKTLSADKIRQDLSEVRLDQPLALATLFMQGPERLRKLTADAPLNTDAKPLIEFSKTMAPTVPMDTYRWMMDNLEPVSDYFVWNENGAGGVSDSLAQLRSACEQWYRARRVLYEGKFASWVFQEPSVAVQLYLKARALNPEDEYIGYFAGGQSVNPDSLAGLAAENPRDFVVRYQLGSYYIGLGDAAKASHYFTEVTRIVPEHALSWFQLGVCAEDQGRPEEAESYFRKARQINPASPQTLVNLGLLHYRRKQYGQAEKLFLEALEASPNYGQATFNLANLKLRQGEKQEAERLYRETLANDPFMFLASLNLGVLLTNRGSYEEAVGQYRRAIALSPGLLTAYNNLALTYDKMGDPANAEKIREYASRLEARTGGKSAGNAEP